VHTPQLIDAIIRQTTVLIARLSTDSGLRAPLRHVADRLFLDLVTELEGQGVGRKVVADMFGLALRSYQQKVQRLQESSTAHGATLWEGVLEYIQTHETATRAEVLAHFSDHDSATVRGVLSDLVSSALVYRTGSGDATLFRAAPPGEVPHTLDDAGRDALLAHLQAVTAALCDQVAPSSARHDAKTFTFELWPGHPCYQRVESFLERARQELEQLRREVAQVREAPEPLARVSFYFGQAVVSKTPAT
jgi:hypothetical protein